MTDATKASMPQPGRSLFSRFRKKTPMRTRWGVPSADAINLRSRVIALEQENNTLKNEVSMLENKIEFLQQENLMLKVKVDETKDKNFKEGLGKAFSDSFIKLKMEEWHSYTAHFSEWEKTNTLDI